VAGRLVNAIEVNGRTVIPAGAPVQGTISEVKSAKRFGGQAMVAVTWNSVALPGGGSLAVEGSLTAYAKKETGKDTAKIAGGAAAGAILGKVLGGDSKDAAAGAVVGGGIGTAVASKRGAEAILPAETTGMVHTLADASIAQPAAKTAAPARTAAAPARAAAAPAKPAPAPTATLPAGREMEVMLVDEAASDISLLGDAVAGRLVNAVEVNGRTVIPAGAPVQGTISEVKSAKRFGGQAMVSVTWTSVTLPRGGTLAVEGSLAAYAKKETGKDTAKIAGGAAAGALLGKLLGGSSKDAAAGAVVGGGIGTAVASKRGEEAILPAETTGMVHTLTDASLQTS